MTDRPSPVEVEIPEDIREKWAEYDDGIVQIPDPVLRQVAVPISKPDAEIRRLVDRMKIAMQGRGGVGLAAPQVGVSVRLFIYQMPEENAPIRVIVNPRIVSMKGEQTGPEGCLSIPLLQGDVTRANEVVVKGLDMLGRPIKRRAAEFEARIIQHEMDHLDGILFTDRADLSTLHWRDADEPEAPEE